MPSVLFVCTANVCRSPMAMALFQRRLETAGVADSWKIASAGVWARAGARLVPEARSALQDRGIDLLNYRAQCVSGPLLESFDLILVMSKDHREALLTEFPGLQGRIYLLSNMIGQNYDILDPMGSPQAAFHATARELSIIIAMGLERIVELAVGVEQELTGVAEASPPFRRLGNVQAEPASTISGAGKTE